MCIYSIAYVYEVYVLFDVFYCFVFFNMDWATSLVLKIDLKKHRGRVREIEIIHPTRTKNCKFHGNQSHSGGDII